MISSLKHTRERPVYFNLIRNTRLLSLFVLPDALLFGFPRRLVVPFFLKAESPEEKKLLLEYARKKDYKYTRWAIRTLINWKNEELPSPVVHIHGAKDLTLPIHTVNADYVIPDGGHFMVYNRSGEINAILHKELA
jgi:pimeloyl-ACP methyl ester carboxylesterase